MTCYHKNIIPLTDEEIMKEKERIKNSLEDYPKNCVVCDDELTNPHPDDPPVCNQKCWNLFLEE